VNGLATCQEDHCFITETHYTTSAIPDVGGYENQETQKPSSHGGQMSEYTFFKVLLPFIFTNLYFFNVKQTHYFLDARKLFKS